MTVALGAAVLGAPNGVNAAEAVAPIDVRLAISGPEECVHASGVQTAVRRRSTRVRFSTASEHTVKLVVASARSLSGSDVWRADVELTRDGAREPTRTLETADCASLTEAIGFIVALTFDPPNAARLEPERPTPVVKPSEQSVTRNTNQPTPPATPSVQVSLTPPAALELHVGASFEVVTEAGPLLLPGFGIGLALASIPEQGFGPALTTQLQVSAFPGRTQTVDAGAGARFRLLAGRFTLCPLAFHTHGFTLRPCAFATYGALEASGSETLQPENHVRPWGSAGGGLWASVNLGSHVRVELDAGLGATLIRDTFQFAPQVFHQTAPQNARAALGLGVLLP